MRYEKQQHRQESTPGPFERLDRELTHMWYFAHRVTTCSLRFGRTGRAGKFQEVMYDDDVDHKQRLANRNS